MVHEKFGRLKVAHGPQRFENSALQVFVSKVKENK